MKYLNIREEELKNKVAQDYFWLYDCTKIIGNVDFCVSMLTSPNSPSLRGQGGVFSPPLDGSGEVNSLLWAEAKKGASDIYKSIVQLILTIGKARTFDKYLPPAMIGAFDGEKIAFIPYNDIHEVFYINDFNWNVAPSNHDTKEFKLIHKKVKAVIDSKTLLFNFQNDDRELKKFIKKNFIVGKFGLTKTKIDKNNFMIIYNKWLQSVKPTIAVNWDVAKKNGIIDGDFYLADLLSQENNTLKEKLFVLLRHDHYELDRKIDEAGMFSSKRTDFTDKQIAHTQFWNKYDRPPKEEYWDYIVERRDLLVPQDVRERKGSFFTPQIWVELSQKYLTDVLGENWQDEYFVWDCAAGTGNLLNGLTNKYNIYASTLDTQDVEVMHDRIKNGANLLDEHVFQFDFLNDEFIPKSQKGKLPDSLYNIIADEKKRKKLVVYINPPYAEGDNVRGVGRRDVHVSKIHTKYQTLIGKASSEIFAQFFIRIYQEIPNCFLAEFSKLKILQSPNFTDFRNIFRAKLEKIFLVPANTFDNVKGDFPIGFFIWDTFKTDSFNQINADVYNSKGICIDSKRVISFDSSKYISDWLELNSKNISPNFIGHLASVGNDFQNQRMVFIDNEEKENWKKGGRHTLISSENLMHVSIYFAVRHCIEATWLNDRDQFLFPNDGWQTDTDFQNDCLAYTLFSNNIQSKFGTNHWIPFTEKEVNAREKFESHFMTDFINGKIKIKEQATLFSPQTSPSMRGAGGVLSPSLRVSGGVLSPSMRGQGGVPITADYLHSHNIPTSNLLFSDMFLPYNPKLKKNSRDLRKAGNLAEVLLWKELRADSFMGYSFYRQKPILNYIADFYCKELNLVIEIDGASHETEDAIAYDKERDRQMQVLGLFVHRVKHEDVMNNMLFVLSELENVVRKITPPNPLLEGELKNPNPLLEGERTNSLLDEESTNPELLIVGEENAGVRTFSPEAQAVFSAGRELWKYYHSQIFPLSEGARGSYNVNASLYDIREYFQERNEAGKMNNKSSDENYMNLIGNLRDKLKQLAEKIEPKVYDYEFLKR